MKIAINGFGRIGRVIARQLFSNPDYRKDLQLIAINDLSEPKDLAFCLKHDSTHGKLPFEVSHDAESITVDGQKFVCLKQPDPKKLPWKELGVDLVLECTGRYTDRDSAAVHLEQGAKKVIISAPAKQPDLTVVRGVNCGQYDPKKHHVVSNASCTTNCLAPVVKVLNDRFGVKYGLMTTIHSYTSDQRLLDNIHKDPRRARTAGTNMIPTTTGAAKAIGEVIPALKGKLDGFSIRVPTPNVSLTDFVAELNQDVSAEEVNAALTEASQQGSLKGILSIEKDPLVSSDFNGNPYSSIVDVACTKVSGPNGGGKGPMVKVYAWYDNETGFSCRMLELAQIMGAGL